MIKNKKLIICDWDGTLVDSKEECFIACKKIFELNDKYLTKEIFLSYDSDPNKHIMHDNKFFIQECLQNKIFFELCEKTLNINIETLSFLIEVKEQGKLLAIATNSLTERINRLVYSMGYNFLFDKIIGIEEGIKPKPNSDMLKKLLRDLNVNVEDSVFICDAPRDVIAANSIGMESIALTSGSFKKEDLLKCNPTKIVSNINEIIRG